VKNALTLLQHKYRAGLDCAREVALVVSQFAHFPRADLEKLSPALLQIVLESPELKIEMESDLFRFVQAAVAECGKDYQVLYENYQVLYENLLFEFLDDQDLAAFLESVIFEELNSSMWTAVSRRLVQKVWPAAPEIERYSNGTIPYRNNLFDGIASYFEKQTGGNLVTNGLIEVSCLSGNPYGDKLFQKDWKMLLVFVKCC
jgi:hypothetical protein